MSSSDELVKFVRGLRQVREYTPEPVSEAVINDILEVGRWSGSSGNSQPTEVLVVRDKDVQDKIGNWGAKPAATAGVVFLIVSKNDPPYAADEGRLGERLMLAAAAHGLGASFATLKNEGPDAVKQLLHIPQDKHVRIVISVGHIDPQARAAREKRPGPPRKPMGEFAHFNMY